jgi:hypothetical protein
MNEIIKIENFLPKKFHDEIKNFLFSYDFNWHFLNSVTFKNTKNKNSFGFSHEVFQKYENYQSEYFNFFWPITYQIPSKNEIEIIRIRIGMQTKLSINENLIDDPHVDFNFSHKTLLYYVNDSDGDTIFYSKNNFNKIIFQNTPKENTAIIFDGLIYHSSSHPTNTSARIAININYKEIE